MNKIYNYVVERYFVENAEMEDVLKEIVEKFDSSLYHESYSFFYFKDETGQLVVKFPDGYQIEIYKISDEEDENIEYIRESFIKFAKSCVYMKLNEEVIIEYYDIVERINILEYIFDKCLKDDIEQYLSEK